MHCACFENTCYTCEELHLRFITDLLNILFVSISAVRISRHSPVAVY